MTDCTMGRFSGISKSISQKDDQYEKMYDHFLHDQFREAMNTGKRIIKETPNHKKALLLMGRIQNNKHHFEKATEYFNKVLHIDSGNTEALLGRAQAYFDNELYEKALIDYLELYEQSFSNTEYLLFLGKTYQALQLSHVALRTYRFAVEKSETNISAHIHISYQYLILGQYKIAIEHAEKAKKLYYEQEKKPLLLAKIKDLFNEIKQLTGRDLKKKSQKNK